MKKESLKGLYYQPVTEGKVTDKEFYSEYYYPDKADKRKEESHQIMTANWLRHHHPEWMAFHVENEFVLTPGANAKAERKGRLSGVVDWVIPTRFGDHGFAVIELKRSTKSLSSSVTGDELAFLKHCHAQGAITIVAYGYSSFLMAVKYLESLLD